MPCTPTGVQTGSCSALGKLFEEHMAGKQNHAIRINNVIAFLAWREKLDDRYRRMDIA